MNGEVETGSLISWLAGALTRQTRPDLSVDPRYTLYLEVALLLLGHGADVTVQNEHKSA